MYDIYIYIIMYIRYVYVHIYMEIGICHYTIHHFVLDVLYA